MIAKREPAPMPRRAADDARLQRVERVRTGLHVISADSVGVGLRHHRVSGIRGVGTFCARCAEMHQRFRAVDTRARFEDQHAGAGTRK